MSAGPKLVNSGRPAMAAVAKILPTANPITVTTSLGPVQLKPGTIWSGNKMLFYAAPMYVWYAIDDRVYEAGTGDFIRDEWLNALSEGARRASHWVTVAKIEAAALSGLFVPWYVLLGASCAKIGLFYEAHKREVDFAMQQAPRVIALLQDLKRRSPTLFDKVLSAAGRELLAELPSGISGEDVAFFIGRIIRGAAGAGPELTLGALIKIAAAVTAIVTATHLPGIAAHAVANAAARNAAELKRRLQTAGYSITEEEARTILSDLLSKPDSLAKLQELERACRTLLPTLEVLSKALIASG